MATVKQWNRCERQTKTIDEFTTQHSLFMLVLGLDWNIRISFFILTLAQIFMLLSFVCQVATKEMKQENKTVIVFATNDGFHWKLIPVVERIRFMQHGRSYYIIAFDLWGIFTTSQIVFAKLMTTDDLFWSMQRLCDAPLQLCWMS